MADARKSAERASDWREWVSVSQLMPFAVIDNQFQKIFLNQCWSTATREKYGTFSQF